MVLTQPQTQRRGGWRTLCAARCRLCRRGDTPAYLSTHRCCRVEVKQCCQIVRFFKKCQNMNYMQSLDFSMLAHKKKKKQTTKHTDKTQHGWGWVWQLGHRFAACDVEAALCMCIWWGCSPWVSRGSPRGEICHELGERAGVQIVDYLKCHPLLPTLE